MLTLDHFSKMHSSRIGVKDISMNLKKGEFVSMVGTSGTGKTTLLRAIAGLTKNTTGKLTFLKKNPSIGFVTQNHTLFPWLTVEKNIAFGLKNKKISSSKKKNIVDHYLKQIGLEKFRHFYPKNLSGGMQQRVALARTLVTNPDIILMDEPFAALDTQTREEMQKLLLEIWKQEKRTIIFVTHNINEALFLSDKIYVLKGSPGSLKSYYDVPFSRPREKDIEYSINFISLQKEISKNLK